MSTAEDKFLNQHFGDDAGEVELIGPGDIELRSKLNQRDESDMRRMGEEMVRMADRMQWDEGRERVVDRQGKPFPPASAMRDSDGELWLYDGFHRIKAARRSEMPHFQVEVQDGGELEAFKASLSANSEQQFGMRRTRESLRNAVKNALKREEIWPYTDSRIADLCYTTRQTVSKYRVEVAKELHREIPSERITTDGDAITVEVDDPTPWRSEADEELAADDEDNEQRARQDARSHASDDGEPTIPGAHLRKEGEDVVRMVNAGPREHSQTTRTVETDQEAHDRLNVVCTDFRRYMQGVEDGSADIIISSGTSKSEHIDYWHKMTSEADRIFGDQGLFLALPAVNVMPSVFQFLERTELDYLWAISLNWNEPTQVGPVSSTYTPILVYGKSVDVQALTDEIDNVPRSFAGEREIGITLANRFAKEGDHVLNPMCGRGGFAAGMLDAGCEVTAIDNDKELLDDLRTHV